MGKGQTEVVENHILFLTFSIPPFFPQTSYFFFYFVPNNYIIQILEVLILLIILSGDFYSK